VRNWVASSASAEEILRSPRRAAGHAAAQLGRQIAGLSRMDQRPRYWFAAKRDGRGWSWPLTWEGWGVYAVWLSVLFWAFPFMNVPQHPIRGLLIIMGSLIPVAGICYWKGEPLTWRS
jgi:hypothetical protein